MIFFTKILLSAGLLFLALFLMFFSNFSKNKNVNNNQNNTKIITKKSQLQNAFFLTNTFPKKEISVFPNTTIQVGAENLQAYLPFLKNKKIALVVNHTALIKKKHLVDTILSYKNTHNIEIVKIFAPEHGFRGEADAGEKVANTVDLKTNIPLISLYGKQKKPSKKQLEDIDILVFDMQDVGVRFYTYISTLHYVMEACAEFDKTLLVLDRPNPRGNEIEGNIRKKTSFVAMHPIPIVHGLTIGELAQMINGERWLKNDKGKTLVCSLKIIKNENYTHTSPYILPMRPSPNLPNGLAVALYPSLCLFEGTNVSVGRGTDFPFEVAGVPFVWGKKVENAQNFAFVPTEKIGAKNPMHKGKQCFGVNIGKDYLKKNQQKTDYFLVPFSLQYVIDFYKKCPKNEKKAFFNKFFDTLAGDTLIRNQIIKGISEKQIKKTWQKDLEKYKIMRKKYLLYAE